MGLKILSEDYRKEVLKLNLKTPPDIVLGLVDLSGAAMYAAYLDALGKDAVIKTDKVSVTLKDPGNIVTDSIVPRTTDLNKNLKTPNDIKTGIGNLTGSSAITQQYLAGRGLDTVIHDFNVINPGDVVADSVAPRTTILNKNIKTPNDITTGIGDLTSNAGLTQQYLAGRGLDTVIGDKSVIDPGTIDTEADIERAKLLKKNKPFNNNDPSENDSIYADLSDGAYTYTSLLDTINKLTVIHDLAVPNVTSVSSDSNQTALVTLNLALQKNRYVPVELNTFESTILSLQPSPFSTPYINAFNSGVYNFIKPEEYTPSAFLSLRTTTSPISILSGYNTDPVAFFLNSGTEPILQDETLLMNIAALEIKFNFESRIKRAIERETIGRTYLDEAMTNPLTALNLLTGRQPLFEANFDITVPSNIIGKGAEFIASLAGVTSPVSLIRDINVDYTPKCFGNTTEYDSKAKSSIGRFVDDLMGKTARSDKDIWYLNHTGNGQKYALFNTIKRNKYQPDYLVDYQSGVFEAGSKVAQFFKGITGFLGIGSGKNPTGYYYIGNKTRNEDPFYLLQDADGDQVKSNEELIRVITNQVDTGTNTTSVYEEPGYDQVSQYGSLETDFVWKISPSSPTQSTDTVYDFTTKKTKQINVKFQDTDKLSYTKSSRNSFRECSILFKTSQLLEKGINNFGSPIDQTLTKFYDGYDFVSRANATIAPVKVDRLNKQGEVIGYRYLVPGLDISGKRDEKLMYEQAELCRVWTKARPYSKITDLVRYKELIRRERNSVLDRYGNLNIHPSELNVNDGYGRKEGIGAAVTEAFGEKRARKYMFSLENLAWRDSQQFTDLPNCEKGFNGGRVMWFPPYDITFTDDTTANWSTHQFLGRPEPIYTYNNSERSGTLSWKIVVDHPSILNLLTQKELARLTDGEIDEILAAFWAGCVEFDIFELARIWNQFSQSDIDYFKKVIAGLNMKTPNEPIKKKIEKITVTKQPDTIKVDSTNDQALPVPSINGRALFFENDVPLPTDTYKAKTTIYDTGVVEKYSLYFDQYQKLNNGTLTGADSVEKVKRFPGSISDTWIRYNKTIGSGAPDNYFFSEDPNNVGVDKGNWYGFNKQYKDIEKDLSDSKYKQFDLVINLAAYASPLGPDSGTSTYNDVLAGRRVSSVNKWLIVDVLSKVGKLYESEDGTDEVTADNIDKIITTESGSFTGGYTSEITLFRDKGNGKRSRITFSGSAGGIGAESIFTEGDKENVNQTYKKTKTDDYKYFEVSAPPVGDINGTNLTYCCFESDKIAEKVKASNLLPGIPKVQIGSVEAKVNRPYEDVVCGALSIVSSHARRVQIDVLVIEPEPTPPTPVVVPEKEYEYITPPGDVPSNDRNVTKREIAQRILNKLITECDYFELLKKDAPIVYDSLKQKLKYFSPAFHAMTPEGLNARLTFLQQCLRPGETIKKDDNDGCDANNTAFGKPPVCVLRIGDFYNTKIVINNLNISYEPLVWDLNPEGIGVQPMIADIQISFKYIGGSGLRKHVDELQNALSFNYYANTDIYDERTFANNDTDERNLINLERSYFDSNTLDLIPIVSAAERIVPQDFQNDIPYGTIGIITKRRQPTTAGGAYNNDILTAKTYNSTTVYQPYDVVSEGGKFYVRKADNANNIAAKNTLNGTSAPVTNTTYWNEITWRNYGEQPFRLEFSKTRPIIDENGDATTGTTTGNTTTSDKYMSKTYFNSYEISYYDLFQDLYKTYGAIVTNNFKFNTPYDSNSLLLQLALNKNYNKQLTITNTSSLSISDPVTTGITTGITTGTTTGTTTGITINATSGTTPSYLFAPIDDLGNFNYQDGVISTSGVTSGTTSGEKYYLYEIFNNEAAERNYVEFAQFGKLAAVNNQSLGTEAIAPLKLHLYPQNNLYKIGDGKTLVTASGTFNDATRFNPGNLNGGKVKGVDEVPEVAGIFLKDFSNHRKNIDPMISALTDEMFAKLKLDIAHFWHYDTKSKQTYNDYLKYFEVPYKNILSDYLTGKLMDYSTTLSDHIDGILTLAEENTARFGTLLSGVSVVTEGYDLRTDDTKIERFEVIPNEFTLTNSAESIFGYDPYQKYQKMLLNATGTTQTITLKTVRDYVYNRENSDLDKLNLLSMGNGPYFFKQITKDAEFKKLVPSGYTEDNYLVESTAIKNNVVITGSTETSSLMPNFLLGASGITLNTIYDRSGGVGETTTKSIQPTEVTPGTYTDYYSMKYTFEKINYEMFDFSNKMLDIMVNDDFLSKKFDVDISYDPDLDFYNSLYQISPKAYSLFYYGSNKNTLINTPISYYTLNTGSVSGTTTENYIIDINDFLYYSVDITEELVKTLNPSLSSLVGQSVAASGLLDMMFLGFFATLTDADKANILALIKEANKPTRGITNNSTSQINARYKKIEKTLTDVFTAIYAYRDAVIEKTASLNTEYTANIEKVNKSVVKILTETDSSEKITDNPNFFETALMRGNQADYTLVLKDTVDVKKTVLDNYKIFTKYRNVFNIINQSEVPEVVEQATETELSKYNKGE